MLPARKNWAGSPLFPLSQRRRPRRGSPKLDANEVADGINAGSAPRVFARRTFLARGVTFAHAKTTDPRAAKNQSMHAPGRAEGCNPPRILNKSSTRCGRSSQARLARLDPCLPQAPHVSEGEKECPRGTGPGSSTFGGRPALVHACKRPGGAPLPPAVRTAQCLSSNRGATAFTVAARPGTSCTPAGHKPQHPKTSNMRWTTTTTGRRKAPRPPPSPPTLLGVPDSVGHDGRGAARHHSCRRRPRASTRHP